ncbi:MAG: hypothetical protein ABF289_07045 [Clostridiales bacterium]
MTTKLRESIAIKRPEVKLEGEVELDEVYIVAGHKGQANIVLLRKIIVIQFQEKI